MDTTVVWVRTMGAFGSVGLAGTLSARFPKNEVNTSLVINSVLVMVRLVEN